VISEYKNLKKYLVVGKKKEVSCKTVERMLHIRSEVKLFTLEKFHVVPFHKCLVLRNTIQ
jgi:hypothetical protein